MGTAAARGATWPPTDTSRAQRAKDQRIAMVTQPVWLGQSLEQARPLRLRSMRFGPGFGVHVCHGEPLAPARIGIDGEILPQRLFNLDGQSVLPFDPVRAIRAHRPQQSCDR